MADTKKRKAKNDSTQMLQAAAQAQSSEEIAAAAATTPPVARPRLKRLTVRNLGCIGSTPVTVDLDDIVVLVGRNNAGKSTILRAYQLAMLEQSKESNLTSFDFHGGRFDPDNPPEIELETVVDPKDTAPGKQWIDMSTGEPVVRERWRWGEDGKQLKRQGWDPAKNDWSLDGMPWGPGNIAQVNRPEPHRIEAFAEPTDFEEQIHKMLLSALNESVRSVPSANGSADGQPGSLWADFLKQVAIVQKSVVAHAKNEIAHVESTLTNYVEDIFQGYRISFKPNIEENIESTVTLFKSGGQLMMGPANGYSGAIGKQGSGARRVLMWAVLRFLSERNRKPNQSGRPHVLLIDEPELCLHPNAVREARRVLYDLPRSGNWQVMVTTHSPLFIDLSRDNTTVVRVERKAEGIIHATTVFRGKSEHIDEDARAELKLLNLFDPYVAEFFFGGHVILVEGDTEYTAFNYVMPALAESNSLFRDVHVVRARGKATITLLARILNAFGANYAVLHDSDTPTVQVKGDKTITNPAWTNNEKIGREVANAGGRTRLVASLKHFEAAIFGTETKHDKPYEALRGLQQDAQARARVEALLHALVSFDQSLPAGFAQWSTLSELEKHCSGAMVSLPHETLDAIGRS